MQIKLGLVILLTLFHAWCWRMVREFDRDEINHEHTWYRCLNEFPTIILVAVVLLVILKPF